MAEVNERVYARIKKLLEIKESRGATEAEATIAGEHVQRLLQEHELTLAQVEENDGTAATDRTRVATDRRAMFTYQVDLMRTLAENGFCLHLVRSVYVPEKREYVDAKTGKVIAGRTSKRHVLVGRAMNVNVALETYDYLLAAIRRDCPYDPYDVDGQRFLEGAVSRVCERLNQRRREAERESAARAKPVGNGTHRELVLADVYGSEADQNNDVLNGWPAGTTAAKRRENEARWAAREAETERLVAAGVDRDEAFYRTWGYEPERAAELATMVRKARATASRRTRRATGTDWTRGERAHYEKVNSTAYRAGREAGAAIGLDDQVAAARRAALPRS